MRRMGGSASRLARLLGARGLLLAALLGLVACAGELTTRGEALRLLGTTVPRATLHEQYDAVINAVGGLRPYTFSLLDGALPAGVTLQNGALRGVPTEAGTFEVTVEVSDANLSRVSQAYTLQVTAAPPPRFVLDAPLTEVRGDATVRARLEDARLVTGVRSLITWDPDLFSLAEGGPVAARRDVALLWQATASTLEVDVVPLGKVLGGTAELFRFTLVPVSPPVRVQASFAAEVLSSSPDPERGHDYLTGVVGAAPRQAGVGQPIAPGVDEPDVTPPDTTPPDTDEPDTTEPGSGAPLDELPEVPGPAAPGAGGGA